MAQNRNQGSQKQNTSQTGSNNFGTTETQERGTSQRGSQTSDVPNRSSNQSSKDIENESMQEGKQ